MITGVAGIRFTETMRGYFAKGEEEDYREAARRGKREATPLEFTLTVYAPDMDAMLADEQHEAEITGSVSSPLLHAKPLRVTRGRFHLFVRDADCASTRRMIYRLALESEDGDCYFLDGHKLIHDDWGFDLWYDTTALFITVHDGDGTDCPVLGRGLLRIHIRDFIPQLLSMRITGGVGLFRSSWAMFRFLRFFGGVLAGVYLLGKFFRRKRGRRRAADPNASGD